MIGKKRNSFTGMLMLHQEAKSNPAYACVSDHGEVILIQLSNLFSSIRKLHGLDSPAIGVYSNEEINQYYVLT